MLISNSIGWLDDVWQQIRRPVIAAQHGIGFILAFANEPFGYRVKFKLTTKAIGNIAQMCQWWGKVSCLNRSVLDAHVSCANGIKPVLEMQAQFTAFGTAWSFFSFLFDKLYRLFICKTVPDTITCNNNKIKIRLDQHLFNIRERRRVNVIYNISWDGC